VLRTQRPRREKTVQHPPPFDLDRFVAGELSKDAEIEIVSHVKSCGVCDAYLKNVALDRDALLFRTPPATFVDRIETLASMGKSPAKLYESTFWKAAAAAVAAMAAGILIFISLPENKPATTRWMGSTPAIEVYLNRNGITQTINDLKPIVGDRLRYKITLPPGKQGYAALVGIEGRSVLPLLPGRGDSDPFFVSGERLLPGSVEIEPGNNSTSLILIVREKPFAMGDIVKEVEKSITVSPDDVSVPGIVNRIQTNTGLP
jgi:hypothetical protein